MRCDTNIIYNMSLVFGPIFQWFVQLATKNIVDITMAFHHPLVSCTAMFLKNVLTCVASAKLHLDMVSK